MGIMILLSYVPALWDVYKNAGPGAPRFNIDNPVPDTPVTK